MMFIFIQQWFCNLYVMKASVYFFTYHVLNPIHIVQNICSQFLYTVCEYFFNIQYVPLLQFLSHTFVTNIEILFESPRKSFNGYSQDVSIFTIHSCSLVKKFRIICFYVETYYSFLG